MTTQSATHTATHSGTGEALAIHGGSPAASPPVPFMSLGLMPADIAAVNEVLASGMLRAAGRCAALEDRFAALSDAKHALTCANGTCALQLAYEVLVQPGDEVIVPAWTYIATAAMIVARGATPVFCDVHPDTFQIDVADAAKKITPKTRAIACTHLYGCPVDIAGVQALAKAHNLKVVYDAAQSHLARYQGKGIGAFGDAVTYSFYATKNLGTGEGGLISCNDDSLARDLGLLRSHGETEKYLHERVGYNYRMNDLTGAIGLSKLDRLPAETAARQQAAERYTRRIDAIAGLEAPRVTPGAEAVWHLYTVKLDPAQFTCDRDTFCKALSAEGVPTAVHYPRGVTRQPAFKAFVTEHPPVSDGLSARVFSLPMHHDMDEARIQRVAEALEKVARHYRR